MYHMFWYVCLYTIYIYVCMKYSIILFLLFFNASSNIRTASFAPHHLCIEKTSTNRNKKKNCFEVRNQPIRMRIFILIKLGRCNFSASVITDVIIITIIIRSYRRSLRRELWCTGRAAAVAAVSCGSPRVQARRPWVGASRSTWTAPCTATAAAAYRSPPGGTVPAVGRRLNCRHPVGRRPRRCTPSAAAVVRRDRRRRRRRRRGWTSSAGGCTSASWNSETSWSWCARDGGNGFSGVRPRAVPYKLRIPRRLLETDLNPVRRFTRDENRTTVEMYW